MTGSVSGDGTRASRDEATTGGDAATRASEDGVPRGARVDSDGLFATVMRGIEVDARTGLLFSDLVRVVASRCAAMEEGEIPVLLVEAVDVHESVETVLAAFSRLAAEEARLSSHCAGHALVGGACDELIYMTERWSVALERTPAFLKQHMPHCHALAPRLVPWRSK